MGDEREFVCQMAENGVILTQCATLCLAAPIPHPPSPCSTSASVSDIFDCVAISASGNHSLALIANGTVRAFGQNTKVPFPPGGRGNISSKSWAE